ncbi:unannotated protein [freshwater metagenome]|uniref:Unannotated protein n=1 Tax=freshwater metagenome TaxID=449393 RepID=A0A6J7Q7E6_9ZZZZ
MNMAAATSITLRRPKRSAKYPANQAPTAEPIKAIETTTPRANELRPKVALIADEAPLITAESKPNKNPPRAAVEARATTRPVR